MYRGTMAYSQTEHRPNPGSVNRIRPHIQVVGFCAEKMRLQAAFLRAIHEINRIQGEQARAVIEDDADFSRFDASIHAAQEQKELAKYAWIAHVETHGCHDGAANGHH
jgi:hypothetical protein